jgi:hypothetical protein
MIEQYIGTFWTKVFRDSLFINNLLSGTEDVYAQADEDTDCLNKALSRHTIEPYRTMRWMFATFSESQMNQDAMTFNQENVFFNGEYQFGDRLHTLFSFSIDPRVRKIPYIMSSPTSPEVVLQENVDYYLDLEQNLLMFRENPFNMGFSQRFLKTEGEPELGIALWFYRTELDYKDVPYIYGEPAKIGVGSSEYFKRIVNAIWDLRVEGGTIANVNKLLCAVVDTDYVDEAGTVEDTFVEGARRWAKISGRLYSAPASIGFLKDIGDSVLAGEMIFDAVTVYTGRDTIPYERFPALHLSNNFIPNEFTDGVLVENLDAPFPTKELVVFTETGGGQVLVTGITDPSYEYLAETPSQTILSLLMTSVGGIQVVESYRDIPFRGRPDTVQAFTTHLAGLWATIGKTMFDNIIEDNFEKVPDTVNLFREYQSRAFANNSFFVYLNTDAVPAGMDVGMALSYIKFTIPAYTTIFTYLEGGMSDEVDLNNVSDSLQAFLVADVENQYSGSNVEDSVGRKLSL